MHESFDLQFLYDRKSTSSMLQMVGANKCYMIYQSLENRNIKQNLWSAQKEYEMVLGQEKWFIEN